MERPLRERAVRLRHVQVDDDGVRLAVHDWPAASAGDGSPATVLFVHATGYHSRLWDGVISLMPPHIRCLLEAREHTPSRVSGRESLLERGRRGGSAAASR